MIWANGCQVLHRHRQNNERERVVTYRIDLHMHTVASSHAYSTIQDYVNVAKAKGLELIAITDHGPDMEDAPHPWHFINMRVIPRIIDDVGILRGIEANIKNIQGEIDCSARMYDVLDFVMVGFHEPVFPPQDIETHTAAMIATIKNPMVNMISHPDNPKFPVHFDQIAEAAAKYHVALEVNNSSFAHSRPGSEPYCRQMIEAVKKAEGYLFFGSDSHIAQSVGGFDECLRLTQALDFPQDRILNVDKKQLFAFIQRKKATDFSCFQK